MSEHTDLRTRTGQEEAVIREVRENGGFSIFWAFETTKRAWAIQRLVNSGCIIRGNDTYPWCSYKVAGE